MLWSGTTTSTGLPSGYRRLVRMRSAVRRAMDRVCASSDSRTPCWRPSTAGRMPIRGHSPTNRPEVVMVAMCGCLSRTRGGSPAPTVRRLRQSIGRDDADGQQEVRVQPLLARRDRQRDVWASRRIVEREPSEALELYAGQQRAEVLEDDGFLPIVWGHHVCGLDRDGIDEGAEHVRDADQARR